MQMASHQLGPVLPQAIVPNWQWEDFFSLTPSEEPALKKRMAVALAVRYTDNVNGNKPFALRVAGVEPWDVEKVKDALIKATSVTLRWTLMCVRQKLEASKSMSTVVMCLDGRVVLCGVSKRGLRLLDPISQGSAPPNI